MIPEHVIPYASLHPFPLIIIIIMGLSLLIWGGSALCNGASNVALRCDISPSVVGLTIVSIATSMPELITSLYSVLRGNPDIAMGNIIGSNLGNTGLILGVSALIYPMTVCNKLIRREVPILIGATLVFAAMCFFGVVTRWMGLLLLTGHGFYIAYILKQSRTLKKEFESEFTSKIEPGSPSVLRSAITIVAATIALQIGADLLVNSSVEVAYRCGVEEVLIGLTLVALGTSLPELATAVSAAYKKQTELCLGNIIGSNLFNILFVAGGAACITPIPVNPVLTMLELPALITFTLLLCVVLITDTKVTRLEGLLLLLGYFGVIGVSFLNHSNWI